MHELHTPGEAASWLRQHVRGTLQTDSRKLAPGDGFIAWPGAAVDARAHVGGALALGATACLVERAGADAFHFEHERIAAYTGLKAASALVAAEFFGHPSQQLDVVAVTGTNGKTSTVWWLAQALSGAELHPALPCAMVGTLGVGRPPAATSDADLPPTDLLATGLTTPDPVLLQASLRRFADAGLRACALEASSIGIDDHRLDGTLVRTAIFTNFTQDHLDYHGNMAAYWRAKARLFRWPGLRAAVLNIDDPKGAELVLALEHSGLDIWTVSARTAARLRAGDTSHAGGKLAFDVIEGDTRHRLETRAVGQYNVSNLLGVIAAMRSLQVPLDQAVAACHALAPVPGRMQCVDAPGKPLVAVDYAHTPDALEKALQALRPLTGQRGGQLWCVFGCGGNRDPGKRALMGLAAANGADQVVVTSDNPRNEDPQGIIDQIMAPLAGRPAISQQVDRALAIAQTLQHAAGKDVVLVAGKGHEAYQEVAGVRVPFSDLEQVRAALADWRAPSPCGGVPA